VNGKVKRYRVELLLWLVVLIWAGNYAISKVGLREFSPLVFATLRFALAAPFLVWLLAWREGTLVVPRSDMLRVIFVGLVGIAFYQYIFNAALKYASVTNVALGLGVSPIFTVLLGAAAGQEKLCRRVLVGSLIAFSGLALVITLGPGHAPVHDSLLGDALALASGFFWGLYPILITPLLKRHSALWVTGHTCLVGTLALIVYACPALLATNWQAISWQAWASLIYAALPVTVVALVAWSYCIEKIGSNQAMVYSFLSTPTAIAMAALLLGETVTLIQALGVIVTLYGIYMVKRPSGRRWGQSRLS
jgi:drug/metabolite transporter (DMT)-like permease